MGKQATRNRRKPRRTAKSLDKRRRVQDLARRVNDVRIAHGGDTYSMTQIRSFAAAQCGAGADHRERFLRNWLSVYSEYGPKFTEAGITIQEVDDGFISDPRCGVGPDAYIAYAEDAIAFAREQQEQADKVVD